jgi:hypothetical protein
MIRRLSSGEYRPYSRGAAEKQERAVQFFKRRG